MTPQFPTHQIHWKILLLWHMFSMLLDMPSTIFCFVWLIRKFKRKLEKSSWIVRISIGPNKQTAFWNKSLAESFYKISYGSSIITSKKLSKNFSNQNKHFCFCCLQDKTWIQMPKRTIFVISSQVFLLITEIFWPTFWRNNWWSIIEVVEKLCYFCNH